MRKWLEQYYERNDERFMRVIRDTGDAEKYLSDLYRHRITISIVFLVFAVVWILLMIIASSSNDSAIFLGMLLILLMNLVVIDSQIKMIQIVNFMKSNRELGKGTVADQGEQN